MPGLRKSENEGLQEGTNFAACRKKNEGMSKLWIAHSNDSEHKANRQRLKRGIYTPYNFAIK
jgi:hypothetical protein